ncbi:hypothetical protein Tco_1328056, partial [Tanacetum coccineum]
MERTNDTGSMAESDVPYVGKDDDDDDDDEKKEDEDEDGEEDNDNVEEEEEPDKYTKLGGLGNRPKL